MTRLLALLVLLALWPGLMAARCGGPEAVSLEELRQDEAPSQFRERFRQALEFQRRVGEAMRNEARGGSGARTLLRGLEQPLVAEQLIALFHKDVPQVRELMETAVVVGDRAWLPFLRARHALQSREAQRHAH